MIDATPIPLNSPTELTALSIAGICNAMFATVLNKSTPMFNNASMFVSSLYRAYIVLFLLFDFLFKI